MRMSLRALPFWRRCPQFPLRKLTSRVPQQHLLVSLRRTEATVGRAREPAAERRPPNRFPGWEKVLCPSQPMVAARQIPCERSKTEVLQLERKAGLNPLNWRTKGNGPLSGDPLAYMRVRNCPASNTTSQFSGSDGVSKEGLITGKGP